MSTLTAQSPVKVWDNAAFDAEAPAAAGEKTNLPWLPLQPISLDPAKENRSPNSTNQPLLLPDIDSEIEELEREIARLSKKLHLLKIKKNAGPPSPKRAATPFANRGRIVPAKFMNNAESATPLQHKIRAQQSRGMSLGPTEIISRIPNASLIPFPASATKKAQESPGSRRRGLSLGPAEISAGIATPLRSGTGRKPLLRPMLGGIKEEKDSSATLRRRGMSIGPAEIFSASRSQLPQKGAKETRARGSLSASPKPRRAAAAIPRVSAATVGAKKPVRREEGPVSNIKPKALFQEAKTPGKRPNAKVRIVASRYSLIGCKKRKWSLQEPGKGDRTGLVEGGSGSRSLSLGGPIARSSTSTEEEERSSSPASIMKMAAALPKIRTLRCGAAESPRDSGCAKRVAELVGRRSCFAAEDDGSGSSPCQSLNFDEEDQ